MSMLLDGSDSVMGYVVGCEHDKKLLAAFPTIGRAVRGKEALQAAGHDNLVLHNITHSKCPEWIKEIVLADTEYCARMESNMQKRADGLRRQVDGLMAEIERIEALARVWREAKGSASSPSPGI